MQEKAQGGNPSSNTLPFFIIHYICIIIHLFTHSFIHSLQTIASGQANNRWLFGGFHHTARLWRTGAQAKVVLWDSVQLS